MPALRSTTRAFLLSFGFAMALAGCRGRLTQPPYPPRSPPEIAALLAVAAPQLNALQVASAKIRLNRSIAGNLMFVAQWPSRFAGQIQVSGKELVSLAFHEQGYALRYVAGGELPEGFYSGPPSACAVEELLGVQMAASEVLALLLGGAPLIAEPREVVSQGWDRRSGEEVLRLRGAGSEEELRFRWVDEHWWPSGATLWRRAVDGSLVWTWTVAHEDPHQVGPALLPSRTVISRPGGRKPQRVTITFREQNPAPAFAAGGTGGDDWGDDDSGWEDEDTGGGGEEGEAEAARPRPAPAIPAAFVLTGDGLPGRGDLCRGRR
ncbi:MAG TPA: hypothetical protein PKW35_00130 [Nannocystaceae bacterium]|nr:hypothetical protein [Nannocystaceae bacterium]